MGRIEDRLVELGFPLPEVVPPVAAYVPAVVTGNLVYTAGQLPMVQGKLAEIGKVPTDVSPERAKELAQISALNALAAVKYAIGDLDRVTRVVKVTGFIASTADFTGLPVINNGASEFLGLVFGDAGVHARTTVGVASLPLDAPVEVELIVEFIQSVAPECNLSLIAVITDESARVVTSPTGLPSATSRSSLRIILPDLVFGNSVTTMI